MTQAELRALIRTIPDYPKPGIQFRDITTLLANPAGLQSCVDTLAEATDTTGSPLIAGLEARGFIFGAALANRLGLGFLPVRKAGKLPVPALRQHYSMEYGKAELELDPTLVPSGHRVIIVDDLLATGGTAMAGVELVRRAGGTVDQALFAIDLPDLGGSAALAAAGVTPCSVITFAGH